MDEVEPTHAVTGMAAKLLRAVSLSAHVPVRWDIESGRWCIGISPTKADPDWIGAGRLAYAVSMLQSEISKNPPAPIPLRKDDEFLVCI